MPSATSRACAPARKAWRHPDRTGALGHCSQRASNSNQLRLRLYSTASQTRCAPTEATLRSPGAVPTSVQTVFRSDHPARQRGGAEVSALLPASRQDWPPLAGFCQSLYPGAAAAKPGAADERPARALGAAGWRRYARRRNCTLLQLRRGWQAGPADAAFSSSPISSLCSCHLVSTRVRDPPAYLKHIRSQVGRSQFTQPVREDFCRIGTHNA